MADSAAATLAVRAGSPAPLALNEEDLVAGSAAVVQAALRALPTIGAGNVTVARTGPQDDYTYTVTFTGAEVDFAPKLSTATATRA